VNADMNADEIRIADLRQPVLDATQRSAVEYAASLDVHLDEDHLLDAARRRTGL